MFGEVSPKVRTGINFNTQSITGLLSVATLTASVINKTANYTLLSTDSGKLFTVTTSTSGVVLTLPAGAAGLWYEFKNKIASTNTFNIAPNGTDKIDNVNASYPMSVGSTLKLVWDSVGAPNEWIVL